MMTIFDFLVAGTGSGVGDDWTGEAMVVVVPGLFGAGVLLGVSVSMKLSNLGDPNLQLDIDIDEPALVVALT